MTRFFVCCSVVLLSCSAIAQSTASTPVPAGVTSTVSPQVQQFQKIEDSWSNAINLRDQYGLELVLSPLFVNVSSTGDFSTRDQQIATLISEDDKTMHLDQRVVTVRMMGDIAVANGTYTLHHKVGSSETDEKGVFTQVFERVRGNWLCVNSQRTAVQEGPNTKGKAKPKKQSNAELPFHIPLFSRGDK